MMIRGKLRAALLAATVMGLGACQTGAGMNFMAPGNSVGDLALTAGRVALCFEPPATVAPSDPLNYAKYLTVAANYQNAQSQFEVCRVKNVPQLLVTSAELSKLAIVEIADSLAALETASDSKSAKIQEIAERVKATPANELDLGAAFDELNAEANQLDVLNSGSDTVHPPEVIEQAALAEARLGVAARALGQSIGATYFLFNKTREMTPAQQQQLANYMTQSYSNQATSSNYVAALGSITVGTAERASQLIATSSRVSRVLQRGDYVVPQERINEQIAVSEADVERILGGEKSDDVI